VRTAGQSRSTAKSRGWVRYSEELEPRYRHATIDVFLDPAWRGPGFGAEVVRRSAQYLIEERGHHRVTIDPALGNAAATREYEKAGFRPVGVMRAYERDAEGDGWHDGLLVEFVVVPWIGGWRRDAGPQHRVIPSCGGGG